jgi:hypothetical protein
MLVMFEMVMVMVARQDGGKVAIEMVKVVEMVMVVIVVGKLEVCS